jgi:predicted MPP superfamily phosphohydrolase
MKGKKQFLKKLILIGCLVLGAGVFLFVWGLTEASSLTVTQQDIAHPDVPEAFSGFTIAFLSDFHFGPFFSLERTTEVVARTNGLKPDLILLGGDYTDAVPGLTESFWKILAGLRAPAGVFAVLGNDDYKGHQRFIIERLRANGIAVLDNEARWITRPGGRIKLGGVSDLGTWRYDLKPTVADTHPADFVILLVHQPDFIEVEKDERIDLALSGHTHGGQVNLFGWSPFVPSSFGFRFREGVVRVRNTTLVISRGLGTVILPVRLGSPPEILLVRLAAKHRISISGK